MSQKKPTLSIIIPVYNSQGIIKRTVERTVAFLKKNQLLAQIILVNDRSTDASWKIIKTLAQKHTNVIAINLLKNYGQHSAVYCGLEHAQGEFIVTMDDDLQNPPEEILKLYREIKKGHDAVFGKFKVKHHSLSRRLGSHLVGYFNQKIFAKPAGLTLSNYRIFTHEVAQRMANYQVSSPYIPGMILMFSDKLANVEVRHLPRTVGKSNYDLIKILKLVSTLLFNYSSYPIKLISLSSIFLAGCSFIFGLSVVLWSLFVGYSVEGWATVIVLISFFAGVIILILGIMGEYLARVMMLLHATKPYIVKQIVYK